MATARWTAAISVLLLLLTASPAPAQVNFTTFTSEHGRFSLLMPGAPKQSSKDARDSAMSAPYKIFDFVATAGKLIFIVVYADYPADFKPNVETELKANQDNFNTGVKAELIATKRIDFRRGQGDLLPALEFTSASASYNFKSVVIWEGPRAYQIIAGSPRGTDATREIDRFLASIVLKRAN
jgi:hypothetical protein